jgi:hypothetical protein
MATNIRRRRIRRAFEEHEESVLSPSSFERGIGKLPKKQRKSREEQAFSPDSNDRGEIESGENRRSIHPIESRILHNGDMILKALERHGGYMPLGDHSPPQKISREFGMSKRVFKQAIGHLWKMRKIEILPNDGIRIKGSRIKAQIGSPRPSSSGPRKR